jgi:hypothetical protein
MDPVEDHGNPKRPLLAACLDVIYRTSNVAYLLNVCDLASHRRKQGTERNVQNCRSADAEAARRFCPRVSGASSPAIAFSRRRDRAIQPDRRQRGWSLPPASTQPSATA